MSAESEEKTIARIHECFSLFDRTRNSSCDERDVGTIIRSLGLNPSEKQARARPDEEVSRAPTMKKKIPSLSCFETVRACRLAKTSRAFGSEP